LNWEKQETIKERKEGKKKYYKELIALIAPI